MRRAALAAGAAFTVALTAACHHRPAPAPVAGPGPRPAPVVVGVQPVVRVGIVVDRDTAAVSARGQFRLVDANGGAIAVSDAGRAWVVRAGDAGQLLLYREGRDEPLRLPTPVIVTPEREGDDVLIGGRRYRGDAVLLRGSVGVTVVNRVPIELYLQSVVALELGFRAPSDREAVMAQAVAARTYAVRYRGRREALGFDVFATDADQVYGGTSAEFPEVTDAVQRTVGQILTWQGQPIQALFHSTCGYSTEAGEEVFQNRDTVPYLRATSDRFGDGDHDFYCGISPKFRWREEWDADGISAILARTLPAVLGRNGNGGSASVGGDIGRVTDIRIGRTTPTGRVAELVVTTTTGTYTVNHGRVRDVFRPTADRALLSTLFQLHVEKNSERLTKVVASGAGFGHGVGMCQFGAVGRARAGQDYRRILATYYHGTTLERIY